MTSRTLRLPLPVLLGLWLGFLLPVPRPAAETGNGRTLVVPPYLDLLVFDLLGERRGGGVEILPPGLPTGPRTEGPQGIEEIRLGETILAISLHRPAPGRWTFRTGHPARIRILAQRFYPRGILLEPAGEKPLRQNDPVSIGYRLLDAEGAPLRELSRYPLSPDITLVRPDGQRVRLRMERRPDLGEGVFRARSPATCTLAGRYWTEVVVATRDLDGRTVTVFQDHWSGFSVEPLPP